MVTRQEKIRNWKPVPAEKTVPKKEFEKTKIPTIPGYNDPQTLQDFLASEGFLFRDGRPFVVQGMRDLECADVVLADELLGKGIVTGSRATGETPVVPVAGETPATPTTP